MRGQLPSTLLALLYSLIPLPGTVVLYPNGVTPAPPLPAQMLQVKLRLAGGFSVKPTPKLFLLLRHPLLQGL